MKLSRKGLDRTRAPANLDQRGESLDAATLALLREEVTRTGVSATARRLGVHVGVLTRLLAGLRVHRGSIALLRAGYASRVATQKLAVR
jgi:hypothetical protein